MRKSRILAKVRAGQPALVVTLHYTDPSIYEMVSLMGFDGIWMDMEHHAYSVQTADGLMRAARVGSADIMARPAKGEFMRMGRMLESGAQGILYPRCDDAEEAKQVVRWAKFAPQGERGLDGGNPDMPYCAMPADAYVKLANEQTFVGVQIESQQALDQVEAIAAVKGVDFIFMGPGDFSVLCGFPGQIQHPRVEQALERIAKACRNAGTNWGTVSRNTQRTAQLVEMGATLIAQGADILMVRDGMLEMQEQLGAVGFTFDNQLGAPPAAPVLP